MKSIVLKDKGVFEYSENAMDKPVPAEGQVLIKVECAPLHPSDLYFMEGKYATNIDYPVVPGGEGSGTVISSGGGLLAWRLVGKRVAFSQGISGAGFKSGGSFAEYAIVDRKYCIVLPDQTSFEKGACSLINPLTAVGLFERCRELKANCVILTGPVSQLGRMTLRLLRLYNFEVICIVRKQEHKEQLEKSYNITHVLDINEEEFDSKLYDLAHKLRANVALDCVSGEMPGRLLQAMPHNSTLVSFGQLSLQKIGPINPIVFIFKNQKLETFLTSKWLQTLGTFAEYRVYTKASSLVDETTISKSFGLHQINEAIEFQQNNMSAGKVILKL